MEDVVSQSWKVKYSGGHCRDNQTWQTEWKTASLAKVQLCEYENQTLEPFIAASCFVCQVCLSSGPPGVFSTAHDCALA